MTIMYRNDIDRSLSYVTAKALLEKERATGRATPEGLLTRLKLKQIALAPSVFQARQLHDFYEQSMSDAHSETLKACLKASPTQTLEAVVIWWSGKRWIALDGHHRVEAYRKLVKDPRVSLLGVPVVTFEGSLEAAIARSIELNARDKLPMTYADKANAAWRLVADEAFSKSEIARVTTVHRNTLTTMGKVLGSLKKKHPRSYRDEALNLTWDEARRSEMAQREHGDFEEYDERQAFEWCKRFRKLIGKKPIGIAAPRLIKALCLLSPDAPKALMGELIGLYPELARDELEWRMAEPEF